MAAEGEPGGTSTSPSSRTRSNPPPQAVMGLLNYITATSLDADYAHASVQRAARGEKRSVHPGIAAMLILGVFGALIAVAFVQTSREASDSASSKQYLVKRVNDGKTDLGKRRDRIVSLQREVVADQQQLLEASSTGRALVARLGRLGVLTGADVVTGPGVRVVADNAPNATADANRVQDKDLQRLVNGLWQVGADAISINGQRLTNLSPIRNAGSAITVNYVSINSPYVISVVGNPNTLAAKFVDTAGAQEYLVNQSRYGLQFSINSEESLTLPASSRLNLRFAQPAKAVQ